MSVKPILLTALALMLPLAGAMAQCTNPPAGLVGWWPGDGHCFDLVGANSGTPSGAGFAEGTVRSAFQFSGSSMASLSIPLNPAYHCNQAAGDYTVACWIRPDSTAWECLVNNGQWTLFLYQDTLGFARLTQGNPFHTAAGATPAGQWSHIAVTRNGDTYRLWVNGQLGNITTRGDIPASGGNLTVGADAYGAFYDGRLDELTIFNRGLSASELAALYAAGSAGMCRPPFPPPSGLVAWWSGDGHGLDLAGTHNATPTNGVSYASGQVGPAFSLDGSNDFLLVPDSPLWPSGMNDFTLALWANFRELRTWIGLAGQDLAPGQSIPKWGFVLNQGKLELHVNGPDGQQDLAQSPFSPQPNQWYCLALTRQAGTYTIYSNGLAIGQQAVATAIPDVASRLTLGCFGAPDGYDMSLARVDAFPGLLDEITFFNRSLSSNEIGALYAAGTAGMSKTNTYPPPGLISWWRGENNTSDETGAHPGTPLGGLSYTNGQVGWAFALNGQNAAVSLGNWFNLQQFTLSFWVNPAASQVQWADILDNNHTDSRSWVFQSGNHTSGATSRWSWGAAGVAGDYYWLSNSAWQHVVATMSSDHVTQLYVNGQSRFKISGTGPVAYDGTQFMNLGKHHLLGRYFNGLVDELMVFDRPLDPAEVTSLYVNQGGRLALEIKLVGGDVLLSWPAAGLVLQSSPSLTLPDWQTMTGIQSTGLSSTVQLPATNQHQFFRLKAGR